MWTELWTDDLDASYEFYRNLIGYNLDEEIILEDVEYVVFKQGDRPRAGVIVLPVDEVRSHWMPYVRVDDPSSLAARVEELGGKLLFAPDEEIRHGTVAVVFDPSGAAVALQKWGGS
jgi:predicted enzyme related to lactoylglutathione lyase